MKSWKRARIDRTHPRTVDARLIDTPGVATDASRGRNMSRITLDLLRKRSEHNEGEIASLEEIALHQENIERIELIDKTCRRLKILLLQNNLVSRIENLGRLKCLEYLNLALNNIEVIENLEGLESLRKLDLTVNFIGDLRGVQRLRCNRHLEQLFLMGNPCADYDGYREYTIASLPGLKELDGVPIERSDRIKASQAYASIQGDVVASCARHVQTRKAEVLRHREGAKSPSTISDQESPEHADEDEAFWKRTSRHAPEERVAIAEQCIRQQEQRDRERNRDREPVRVEYKPRLFDSEGRPCNANQPKVSFKLHGESYDDRVVLEVSLYKHLDTSYVDVDVQPSYVRVTIKGKVLQLTLPCEVSVSGSTARRNTITGTLEVSMPRLNPLPSIVPRSKESGERKRDTPTQRRSDVRAFLEIGPVADDLDFSRIVRRKSERQLANGREEDPVNETVRPDDDPDVPPLE